MTSITKSDRILIGNNQVAPARINTVYIGLSAVDNLVFTTIAAAQAYILTQTINASNLWRVVFNEKQHSEAVTITTPYICFEPAQGTIDLVDVITIDYVSTVSPELISGTYMNAVGFYNCIFYDKIVVSNGGDLYAQSCTFLGGSGSVEASVGHLGYVTLNLCQIVSNTNLQSFSSKISFFSTSFMGTNLINAQVCSFYNILLVGDLDIDPTDNGGTFAFYGGILQGNITGANVLLFFGVTRGSTVSIAQSITLDGGQSYTPVDNVITSNNVVNAMTEVSTYLNRAPKWYGLTRSYTNFSIAALTNAISVWSLDTGYALHAAILTQQNNPFGGGGATVATMSFGMVPTYDDIIPARSVFTNQGSTITSDMKFEGLYIPTIGGGAATLYLSLTSDVNLNTLTQGTARLWLLTSALPNI